MRTFYSYRASVSCLCMMTTFFDFLLDFKNIKSILHKFKPRIFKTDVNLKEIPSLKRMGVLVPGKSDLLNI